MSPLSEGYNFKMFHHLAKMILNLITSQAQPKICVSVFEIQDVCNVYLILFAGIQNHVLTMTYTNQKQMHQSFKF